MKLLITLLIISFVTLSKGIAQENVIITGQVLDAKTNEPLINVSVRIKKKPFATTTDANGKFGMSLPNNIFADTLVISYMSYKIFADKFSHLNRNDGVFLLEEQPTVLDEVTILEKKLKKFEIRRLEATMKVVRDSLYAMQSEVTNESYNQFLSYLIQSGQMSLYEKYKPDISEYSGSMRIVFERYHTGSTEEGRTMGQNYDDYPIVNISHEAAEAYCEWLTDLYNKSTSKKKFKEVRFRLPNLKEWQIAALGNKKFKSWNFEDNSVEVMIPLSQDTEVHGKLKTIPVKGNDILYPWYWLYNARNQAQNVHNCWMGNFKIPEGRKTCKEFLPSGDGWTITAKVETYFANGMGLYDISGNVAEMIDEKGKACGGSWDQYPEEATMLSVSDYSGTSGRVGFRVFMEVITEK